MAINADKELLTMKDKAFLSEVVTGGVPREAAFVMTEQVVREHVGRAIHEDLS